MILWRLSKTVLIYHHRPFWAADAIFAKQIMYVPNIIDLPSTKKTSLVSKLCSRCKKKSWSVFIIFARGGLCFIHPNHRHVGAVTVFYVSVHLFLLWYILIPAYLFHVRGVRKGGLPLQISKQQKLASVLGPPCLASETQDHRPWPYFPTVPWTKLERGWSTTIKGAVPA